MIGEPDLLIRAVGLSGAARVVAARTTGVAERLREIHQPSPVVAAALGRVAAGALLLAASLEKAAEREPVLTIEVEGDGPAGRILATASPAGWVRALVHNPAADRPLREDGKLDVGGVVGRRGVLSVSRDLGFGQPYRGVVPLVAGEIGRDLAHYLRESEQTPAAVALGVKLGGDGAVVHAGGYLIQLLPGVSEDAAAELEDHVLSLGEVTTRLSAGSQPLDWLAWLFPGGLTVLDRRPVEFRCGCSTARVEQALKLLGAAEVRRLLEDPPFQPAAMTCGFCRRVYPLAADELARVLLELAAEAGGEPPQRPDRG